MCTRVEPEPPIRVFFSSKLMYVSWYIALELCVYLYRFGMSQMTKKTCLPVTKHTNTTRKRTREHVLALHLILPSMPRRSKVRSNPFPAFFSGYSPSRSGGRIAYTYSTSAEYPCSQITLTLVPAWLQSICLGLSPPDDYRSMTPIHSASFSGVSLSLSYGDPRSCRTRIYHEVAPMRPPPLFPFFCPLFLSPFSYHPFPISSPQLSTACAGEGV